MRYLRDPVVNVQSAYTRMNEVFEVDFVSEMISCAMLLSHALMQQHGGQII